METIRCLLLVEDEPAVAVEMERRLADLGIPIGEVVVATSLAAAIRTIQSEAVDVVLLDLDLGDSRSTDTLVAVRALTDAVVIVLSDAGEEVGVVCLKMGADDFLDKSDATDGCLRRSIRRCMSRKKVRQVVAKIAEKFSRLAPMVGT